MVKAMFFLYVFEILLLECRSVLSPAQRCAGSKSARPAFYAEHHRGCFCSIDKFSFTQQSFPVSNNEAGVFM